MVFLKILIAIIIFMITLLAGILPLKQKSGKILFHKSECLISGVFLGTAIFHLLPDSSQIFHELVSTHLYIFPYLLATIGFGGLWLLAIFAKWLPTKNWQLMPWIIALILSIHSFIAGFTLGLTSTFSNLFIIFFAIVAHKAFDSFALIISLDKFSIPRRQILFSVILFAFITPLGILLGEFLGYSLSRNHASLLEGYFNALAAGTFIYIASIEGFLLKGKDYHYEPVDFLWFFIGFFTMGLLAFWI
jgi:zinc transporter ZupT